LLQFCRSARRAPDLLPGADDGRGSQGLALPGRLIDTGYRPSLRGDASLVRSYLRAGGPGELARRVGGRVRRRVAELVRPRP
jgi:hypothetical protein